MRHLRSQIGWLTGILFAICVQPVLAQPVTTPSTFLLDATLLASNKARLQQGDASLQAARKSLLAQADNLLTKPAHSVVEKTKTPPSGDKHDYMSVGPYWWPDSTKPGGLPYIRKDGQINPDRYAIQDGTYLNALCDDVQTLALSYYFSNDDKYARRAAELLRTWFLDKETRMNPNLNYGQAIPGITEGRGIGLIDTRMLAKLVDAVQLLNGSPAWPKQDQTALQAWFRQFLTWMLTSPIGKDEADEHNNHGTYYDFQTVAFALFLQDKTMAKQLIEQNTYKRIQSQLKEDGSQPHELARTLSWNYSVMNFKGFLGVALLAKNVGIDLLNYETSDGKSLKKAYQWLLPYAEGQKPWPFQQIKAMHPEEFMPVPFIVNARFNTGTAPNKSPARTPGSPVFVLTNALF
ncbi:alginate lyase family protein [Spirosoma sp.]|uniref:alginate lyase family protein n=1 Tax=Spirosoma sp. TaxID=1899569 RepID=UPI002625B7C3|nr:alginate lyase family protein [Spirosoma sp.]MCX6217898.1 alginate lyase family protein [Spirosoma sp.]